MKQGTVASVLAVLAGALGIVSIVTRPFLFGPIGLLVLLVAVKLTADRRLTAPAAALVMIGGLAGTAIAAGYSHPLY